MPIQFAPRAGHPLAFLLALPLTLLLLASTFVLVFSSPVSAESLITNGDFGRDLSGWTAEDAVRGVKTDWDGLTGSGDATRPGSARFVVSGQRTAGERRLVQKLESPVSAGVAAVLTFSWKKNWTATVPRSQTAYVELAGPRGQRQRIWSDKAISNENAWRTEAIDLSAHLVAPGTYTLRLGADLENGGSHTAMTGVWFDGLSVEATPVRGTRPAASILAPSGISVLSGQAQRILGIASDNVAVAKVEVAIVRLSDGLFWNGSSWTKTSVWNGTNTTTGMGGRYATWTYDWTLPTADRAAFRIFARAVDAAGNGGVPPSTLLATVDNVAPTGRMFIEDAASYTNDTAVTVNNEISGVSRMRFSTDNGRTWTGWESYRESRRVTLTEGDGTKTVLGQFKDATANIYQISDSIVLDTTSPVTRSTFPSVNARNVNTDAAISAAFYEEMNPLTFSNEKNEATSSFYLKQGAEFVPATVTYSDDSKMAKLAPLEPLRPGTTYTAFLTTEIMDAAGNPLAAGYSWSFSTAGTRRISFSSMLTKDVGGELSDGARAVIISIPRVALPVDTTITVSEVARDEAPPSRGLSLHGPILRIEPKNLPLNTPATLRIQYQPSDSEDESSLLIYHYVPETGDWVPLETTIDLAGKYASALVQTLRMFTVATLSDAFAPDVSIVSPTDLNRAPVARPRILGVASDNQRVAQVEVAIVDPATGLFWTDRGWQKKEVWLEAVISSSGDRSRVSWVYEWSLPVRGAAAASDGGGQFRVLVRARDGADNTSPVPASVTVRIRAKRTYRAGPL